MTTTITARPAASYVPLRGGTSILSEILEAFADVDFSLVEVYDDDGPSLILTLSEGQPGAAPRIAAGLGLGEAAPGRFSGFVGRLTPEVWVCVEEAAEEEDPTHMQRLWWRNRSRVIAAALLATGYAAGRLTRRWRA